MSFTLLRKTHVPELNTEAYLYRHDQTGAELLSLVNDDENKVFGISFRTPPEDSTGIAHIMEHSVLCGSRKYPVKEPFVELIKGSLNTFLNAMTFSDKTVYPVASTNLKDFYNLVDVYLDAVFFPLIPEYVLAQEGWHYEMDSEEDELRFKGVVFNEMKGAYSSPDGLLGEYSESSLFPDTTYQHDSGGNPANIPDLTYEYFKNFHETYYHPANSRIFFYGDDDPEKRLDMLEEYFGQFTPTEVDSQVSLQPRFEAPKRFAYGYDAGDGETAKKSMVTVNWMLTETSNRTESLALGILTHILLGNSAAPLRKALIDSGLGENLAGGGLETHLRQLAFSTGLKGIVTEDAEKVEAVIYDTLNALARDGIDPETIAASMNTTEFSLRENNTGSFPRGLVILFRILSTWNYDGDPFAPLFFEAPLQAIKDELASGNQYFEALIQKYLIDNPHRTTVVMYPDSEARTRTEAAEAARLAAARAEMTPDDVREIVRTTQELKRMQEAPDSPEALATLPTLELNDIEREIRTIPTARTTLAGVKTLHHDLFTNGIVYLDLGFDLHTLPQEYLPYVPLFSRSLSQMGTETQNFVQLTQRIGQKTGGVYGSILNQAVRDKKEALVWFVLRGKATVPQTGDMLAIMRDMLLKTNFDNRERFLQMVLESKAGKESRLAPAGHIIANTRLKAHFSESGWVSEQMSGVDSLFFIRQLAEEVQNDWDGVRAKLEAIRDILLHRGNMIVNVTLDDENWQTIQSDLADFLTELPQRDTAPQTWSPAQMVPNEGLTFPAQVNYVGKMANIFELGYPRTGATLVVRKYLNTTWMWEKVRVQGGAYGGFSMFDHVTGTFGYLSYRDPNLLATIENYDGTATFLRDLRISEDELTKSIIGTIGDVDGYQLPDAKGYTAFVRELTGLTDAQRQEFRDQILGTRAEDFHHLAEVLNEMNNTAHVVVLGSADAINAANEQKGEAWLRVTRVV